MKTYGFETPRMYAGAPERRWRPQLFMFFASLGRRASGCIMDVSLRL